MLIGGDGADTLDGTTGADSLIGGRGDDTYVVDNAGDQVTEYADEGTDRVLASISYVLGSNVENLTLIGLAAINATGNLLDNVLIGNSSANFLRGGTGADTMVGGDGNDTYVVDNAGDVVTEDSALVAGGVDLVRSTIGYVLGANVENLTLIGSDGASGSGNALDNVITGNAGNNTLDGDAGADALAGGLGDDRYVVDLTVVGALEDTITELANAGIDTVQLRGTSANALAVMLTLGVEFENLDASATGNSLLNITGNGSGNVLTGNAANNLLDGGAGVDTLIGGLGDDAYVVDDAGDTVVEAFNGGTDLLKVGIATVGGTYILGEYIENATLISAVAFNLTGNALDNVLTGNASANFLRGGAGADTMVGGDGNDTYVVDNAGDVVTEDSALVAGGVDLVRSTISYVLGANVENLTLIGSDGGSGRGNALVNVIAGNAGNNTLDGGAGADALAGGQGDDRYVVDLTAAGALEDTMTELANAGVDTVQLRGTSANATAVMLTLGAEFENLDASATGNSLLNITGNGSGNVLTGNAANNLLDGGAGVDTLIGGLGNDNYTVDDAGDAVVEAFNGGTDRVKVGIATVGGTYILGEYIENATLISAVAFNLTGNALNNVLTGNASANFLRGGLGADTMVGRDGNDTYVVDNAGDVVTEDSALAAGGVDLVRSTISYVLGANVENLTLIGSDGVSGRGNALVNVITGNAGNNTLDGGAGADSLIGGRGDDTYVVDNAGDLVTEYADEGTDRVLASISYVLGASLENLTLTGLAAINATGNALGNALVGNAGDNVLDGGVGADTMAGGGGNDTYMVDNAGDIVTETAANGTDRVLVSFTYTLGANIENLTLTGSAAINATGNALDNSLVGNDASNVLTGGAGNDTLAGGAGIDTLIGGTGDDVYVLDLIRTGNSVGWLDSITENSYEGSDTLKFVAHGDLGFDSLHPAVIDHFFAKQLPYDQLLYTGFENLDISETGTNYINLLGDWTDNTLIGNAADNLIIGADGDDVLDGGSGRDRLEGGSGYDVYYADVDGVLNGFATFDDVIIDSDGRGAMIVRADHDLGLTSRAKVVMNYSFDMLDGSRTGLNKLDFYGGERGFLVIGNDAGNVISTGAVLYGAETVLEGRGGNDVLIGREKAGPGPMKLVGGEGDDVFRFDYAYYRYYTSGDNIIVDFTSGSDRIALDFRGFNYFDTGILDADMFVSESSAVAHDPNDYILYDTTTGSIYYDGDGSGFEFAPSEFAKVQNHAVLTADDFFLTGGPIYPV